MWFFSKKKNIEKDAKNEAAVQSIRKDMFKTIDNATKNTKKLNSLLETDATLRIFYATGGDRRPKNGR